MRGFSKLPVAGEQGFSLIELLVSISIVGILAGLALTAFWVYKEDAEYSVAETTLRNARTAIELGDQDAPAGFTLPMTWSTETGGPLAGPMGDILPEMITPEDHMLGVMYEQCTAASSPLQINEFLAAKPCNANRFIQWVRFCNGMEVLSPNVAGNC